ncbi:MAG: carbohydrate binding family 9 domain-containing protein [Spirosomaceae bacterium]|jgi:hypothetical protein|nr:carbohydrate binding family 9 domain-containing protein [Spirosomataceae bacterium]
MKFLVLAFNILALASFGQQFPFEVYKKGNKEKITIDAKIKEAVWQRTKAIANFKQHFPEDNTKANQDTQVWVVYDDKNIYVAAKCFDKNRSDFITSSLRRDFKGKSDKFEVIIDPEGENNNGYVFGVTPLGIEREGLINGGSGLDLRWDCKWQTATKVYEGYWLVEMMIPLHTINYQKFKDSWNINFVRYDYKNNEVTSAVLIPRNYEVHQLATTKPMKFHNYLSSSKAHINVIPYVSVGLEQEKGLPKQPIQRVGIDSRIRIGSSLNLDLTINPDFSQVEADRQITNLSRFELQFEERRQFFIENNDLFNNFGFSDINPFFSRRVGVGRDASTRQFKQQPILFGGRLSGKIDELTRIGVMTVQTAELPVEQIASQNYSVLTMQRKINKYSNIGLILGNRSRFESRNNESIVYKDARFNRVFGVDYNLITKDDKWRGKAFVHHLFRPDKNDGRWTHGGQLSYNSKRLEADWQHEIVGKNYRPDFGFVRQTDYYSISPDVRLSHYFNKKSPINKVAAGLNTVLLWNLSTNRLYEREIEGKVYFKFQNTSYLRLYYNWHYVYLFESFDPTNTDSQRLPIGGYNFRQFKVKYESDKRKIINGYAYFRSGEYYNGRMTSFHGILNKRYQPNGDIGLDLTVNHIRLPKPYATRTLLLIGPNVDWAFNKSMFLKAVVQYNTQIKNINTNIRFQWRYRPVSDIYLVFTNNFSDDFRYKNLGLIFKMNHWFG